MKQVSQVHFRVIDKGIFLPIARRLAREALRVSYWSPWEKAFPTVQDCIGDGFDDVERVYSPWTDKDSVDCWVFPDIGFSRMQTDLLSQGKVVWGARLADILEIDRGRFLEALATTKLPVPPHRKIVGMTALREFLADNEDKFVKVSKFRGDWETLHWRDSGQDESELDARAVKLGPWKEAITFYVFDNIETEIEDGCDTYCIDGEFPSLVIHGMESKDRAFLGAFQKMRDLPLEVRCVTDEFGPLLGEAGYRSFFSSEVRITKDGKSYFIDPTLRAGSPPSQVMCELISNLGDIVWRGANGELVDPKPAAQFGVQGLLCLAHDRSTWRTLEVPEELQQWVKCGFCSQIDGRLCFAPDVSMMRGEVGWLVGIGDTPKSAIEHLKKNAELLPCGAHCEYHALAELIQEVNAAESAGMEFSDKPMPEPEIVVKEG